MANLIHVGDGHHRQVYVHPTDPSKCIKVLLTSRYGNKQGRKYRIQCQRERDYYRFLAKRGIVCPHIANYHGTMQVEIDGMKSADIFDLVRNEDGTIAKTMDVEISQCDGTNAVAKAMHEMYLSLLQCKIISGFKLPNIVVQLKPNAPPKCILIDNIGNSDFIPVVQYIDHLATIKIKRRWRKFLHHSLTKYPNNSVMKKVLRNLK